LASMGIYLFNAEFLYEQMIRDADEPGSSHDFGKDVIPYLIKKHRVYAHRFTDSCIGEHSCPPYYWRDVGTVDAYYEANMDLTKVLPELNLYDRSWPIWTYQEQLPPAKFVFDEADRRGLAVNSLVSGGCIISGAALRQSLLFSNVQVLSHAQVVDSIILPNVDIGQHAYLRRVIVDKGCKIPERMVAGVDPAEDARRFYVTEKGITLITPEMLGQHIHHVR
ncbi:MAG: sugar phosphate nucleotidyltransferase, partial [Burkholderiales bacterium]